MTEIVIQAYDFEAMFNDENRKDLKLKSYENKYGNHCNIKYPKRVRKVTYDTRFNEPTVVIHFFDKTKKEIPAYTDLVVI